MGKQNEVPYRRRDEVRDGSQDLRPKLMPLAIDEILDKANLTMLFCFLFQEDRTNI